MLTPVLIIPYTPTDNGNQIYSIRAQRPLIEKQNRYALYHPFTDALASYLCELPNKVATSVVVNIPLYFMTNLRRQVDGFFVFWLFMLICTLTMSMFFRMLGSLSRTLEETMAPVSTLVLCFIVYVGFVIPPAYMVPWLGWVRWINPSFYSYEALMVNEVCVAPTLSLTAAWSIGWAHKRAV
jgi:ABC-type multidrug transport system permease subunit